MARLRRDRLTNRIGVNIGPRVDGSGNNRGIKSEPLFCMLVGSRSQVWCVFFFESYVLEGIILLPGPNLGLYFCMIMWDGIPRMTSNGPF